VLYKSTTTTTTTVCSTTVPVEMRLHWSTDSRLPWVGDKGRSVKVNKNISKEQFKKKGEGSH